MECERSGNGMLVKLAKLGLISKRTWQTVYCAKTGSLSRFGFGKLYTNVTHETLNIILARFNNKTINLVHLTIKKTTLLKRFRMSICVSRKIDLPRVHCDETEFSLDTPLPVVVPLFH